MEVTLLIVSIVLACTAGYLGYRAYTIAGVLADQQEYIEELEFVYGVLLEKIQTSYEEIQRIDSKGAFESDDETGTTFQLLKQVIDDLNEEAYGTQEESK